MEKILHFFKNENKKHLIVGTVPKSNGKRLIII
jgi:hypothetical protein